MKRDRIAVIAKVGLTTRADADGQQPEEEDEHRVSDAKTYAYTTRISESIERIIAQLGVFVYGLYAAARQYNAYKIP